MKKVILFSLLALGLIGCGGGSGGSSDTNESSPSVNTENSSKIEANISKELEKANDFQKNTIKNYEYYGYQIIKEGYSVEKDGTLHTCGTGTGYVAAKKENNSLLFVEIDNDNEISNGNVPKSGDIYTRTTEDNEDKFTGTLKFIDNEKYIIGNIVNYNKVVNKSCTSEVYMKKAK